MSEITIDRLANYLDQRFPECLAEPWDNTGLLLGDRRSPVRRVMTCLTVTPTVVAEAVQQNVDLVVVHHPLPFKPVASISTDHYYGGMLWELASAGIAIFSPHTRFDSAASGINQQLAERLKLTDIQPLAAPPGPAEELTGVGRGRWGRCAVGTTVATLARLIEEQLGSDTIKWVPAGKLQSFDSVVTTVAVGCGSAGEFVRDARKLGCDLFVTGEATFHTCLEAQSLQVGMLLAGHYYSERFALEKLAEEIGQQWSGLQVWASRGELSPTRGLP